MQVLRRIFGNFKSNIDFRNYFEMVLKFVSIDAASCNEIFFGFLDVNKDKRVCETDLFLSLKSLNTPRLLDLLTTDILKCTTLIE